MAYDNPSYDNSFRYRIGWNLGTGGGATSWSSGYAQVPRVGWEGQGADLAIFSLGPGSWPDFVFMAYDNPTGANSFRYKVVSNQENPRRLQLEIDKLSTLPWPPASVTRNGVTRSLESLYAAAGIELTRVLDQGGIVDPNGGRAFTAAELDAFRVANMNRAVPSGSWGVYAAFLTNDTDGDLGIMFDVGRRRAFAVFVSAFGTADNARILRTTAHELGHALNLLHSDGDAWRAAGTGISIMNQTSSLATNWDFGWSAAELHHFYNHARTRWSPNNGVSFGGCH